MSEAAAPAGEKLKGVEGHEAPPSGTAAHFGGFSTSSKPQYVEEKSAYATKREEDGIARRKGREGREKRMFEKLLKQVQPGRRSLRRGDSPRRKGCREGGRQYPLEPSPRVSAGNTASPFPETETGPWLCFLVSPITG